MSLEYYLLCKTKYDVIILNLKEIIENYNDIFSFTSELDIKNERYMVDDDEVHPVNFKDRISTELIYVNRCRNLCQQQIHKLCNHEFVNDTIDINPECSQNITYCRICEYTIK